MTEPTSPAAPRPRIAALRLPLIALLALAATGQGCAPRGTGEVPEQVIRHNILGTALLSQQKWSEAMEQFAEGLRKRPNDPVLLVNTAVALLQQGKAQEAEGFLLRALEADPDHAHAHYNLGLVERNRGNLERSAEHFARVTAADPEDVLARYNLATVLGRLGRGDEAVAEFRAALERDPTHVSSLYGLGRLLIQRGKQEEGTELIARSQELRALSGLGTAVGNQYGEQGPYAMGVDYPGGGLTAPEAIAVTFREEPTGAKLTGVRSWTVAADGEGGVDAFFATADGIVGVGGDGETTTTTAPGSRPVLAIAAGDVDGDEEVEIAALLGAGPAGGPLSIAALGLDDSRAGWSPAMEVAVRAEGDPAGAALALVDRDHDGDLDAFGCVAVAEGSSCFVLDNDAFGKFLTDAATDLGTIPGSPVRLTLSDADNDRDVDLVAATSAGVHLLANFRNGFRDISDDAGLGRVAGGVRSLEVADLDKDGWMDLVVAAEGGPRVMANRRGRFGPPEPVAAGGGTDAGAVVLDYDNDGFLDLLSSTADGPARVFRNLGGGGWSETTADVLGGSTSEGLRPLVAADLDGDGDGDVLALDAAGAAVRLINEGGSAHRSLRIFPAGVGDNRFAVGTKVEVLAGALRQRFEVTRPLPLVAGLGSREAAESVRLVWPGGVIQDETNQPAGERLEIAQLDRKGTSCPLLYAWRDGGWAFVTDFLGGCAIGYCLAPGVYSTPDTDEYVLIEGGLAADDGRLRVRLNNQLEEVIWFDKAELVVVDHPTDTLVFPNERLMPGPPLPEFRLFASDDVRPVASALDVEAGLDVTNLLRERDRRYVAGFDLLPFKGYAATHTLELDLGKLDASRRVVLLLDGWIDYADSTANVAAHQAGVKLVPPRLEVSDGEGGWREVEGRMGFPAGLPKTMVVDLTSSFPSTDRRIRIVTNMRIYWDRARVMVGGEDTPLRVTRLEPSAAELRFGGFPAETSPDGRKPFGYDPERVEPDSPWKAHAGDYTPFGEVTVLLREIDDRFVTTRAGDEIELTFDAPEPPAPGRTRTYLLFADGFGKDMDPNSAANDRVGPIPFHGMPDYPYGPDVTPPRLSESEARSARRVVPAADGLHAARPLGLALGDRGEL